MGVVATSAATNRSVVFHDGLASPPPDHLRGIDYVKTPLSEEQVLASAALEFGAERVVVVALNSLAPGPAKLAGDERPDALEGAGQALINLGRQDARRWLGRSHDLDGLWQIAPSAAT